MSKPPRFGSLPRWAADSSRSRSRRAIASRPATSWRGSMTRIRPSRRREPRPNAIRPWPSCDCCRPARASRTSARLARRSIRRRPRSRPQKRSCSRRAPTWRGSRHSSPRTPARASSATMPPRKWRWPTRASTARASGYARQPKVWAGCVPVRVPRRLPPPAPGSQRPRRRLPRSPKRRPTRS